MSFPAALRFAGLCAHVPNAPLEQPPTRIWVAMPDARTPKKRSIARHFPGILVPAKQVAAVGSGSGSTAAAAGSLLFWGIERKEITFVPVPESGASPPALAIPDDDDDTDFRHIADLATIAPEASTIEPRFLEDEGSAGLIVARAVLETGTVRTLPRSVNLPVHFPGGKALADPAAAVKTAHGAVVYLGALSRLEIHARDLDGGPATSLVLAGGSDPCEVVIGNLCGDLWLQELTGLEPYVDSKASLIEDADFEAFYLLSNPQPKTDPMGPVPTWLGGGGSGAKCHQTRFSPYTPE